MSELTIEKEDIIYLEKASIEDIDRIGDQLKRYQMHNPDKGVVTIQIKVDLPSIIALIGWIYKFWTFGKEMFFPEGKFRKPKLFEIARNFKIVKGVIQLKNLLMGIWKNEPNAIEKIAQSFDE